MQQEEMGAWICRLRKENHMTQKELASQLNITDKAVSKWERNLSCPDISLLPSLAGALHVTVDELLSGEREKSLPAPNAEQPPDFAEKPAGPTPRPWSKIRALSFSTLAFLGVFVCLVCDLAVSGAFTWSVPAVSCVLFGWLVLLPVVRSGLGGTVRTLLLCTVLILPLLYLLNCLTPVSLKITALSALFVWTFFFSLKLLNEHLLLCAGVTALLAAGLHIAIQLVLLSSV